MQRLLISCLAIAGITAILQADAWNKKTELTVNESIMVPGATLTPGKYVVKIVDSQANRHIVQFTNEREDRVISTVLAIPNQRLEPTGDTEFAFYEGTVGGVRAMQAWFYPGDTFGQEFAYPEQQARQVGRATGANVPAVRGDDPMSSEVTRSESETEATPSVAESTPPPTQPEPVAPSRTQPAAPEARPDPTILTQAQQPEPQPSTQREAQSTPSPRPSQAPVARKELSELPATASPAPLLGLIGLMSLAGALGLRRVARRKS